MNTNQISESEVIKQMATPNQSSMDRLRELAGNRNRQEAVPMREPEVKQTSEFEKGAETTTKEVVTKDTPGVSNWQEYPLNDRNAMPAGNGDVASEPYITYTVKRNIGNTTVEIKKGRFRQNKNGVAVDVEFAEKKAVDPTQLGNAQKKTNMAKTALIEAAQTAATQQATKLRRYISEHARFIGVITDHDNKPTLKGTRRIKKDENGNVVSTSTGFKVAESGCGPVKFYQLLVPTRAWNAFETNDFNDVNVVGNICDEEKPDMQVVTIVREDFLGEIGYRSYNGIDVLESMVDKDTCKVAVSDDAALGVKEHIALVSRLVSVDNNTKKATVMTDKQREKQRKLAERMGATKARLSVGFRLMDTARSSVISPINYIPQKTQVMTPAGASFAPSEGKSSKEMTETYFCAPFRAKQAQGQPFDVTLGNIITPSTENNKVKDKFCFSVSVNEAGIGQNPIFYPSSTEAEVEPYFKTRVHVEGDKYKLEKLGGTKVTAIVEKTKNEKNGNLQTKSNAIGNDGYDASYYNQVKTRFQNSVGTDVHFPSLLELSNLFVKTKSSGGAKRSRNTSIDDLIPAFNLAAIADSDPNLLTSYFEDVSNEKSLKKEGPKVTMWSHEYNAALKKNLIVEDSEL